ncbi:MAG TPA: PEP-CTERM sorting domain-containing protein [Verrucomicrobiae bacterium]|nr:PEP-CTERM sorting domain-containing protein [Verrucomicrobiae bacterium]
MTAVLFCAAVSFQAGAETLNFANLNGTDLSFSGGGFTFTSTNGYQFSITTVNGGVGDSAGLNGYLAPGGPFTIGPITTNGWHQSANVTGTAMLHITDLASLDLTGSIQWDTIDTISSIGGLNLSGTINLTGLSYSGANSDLGALAASGSAEDVVSFQFAPAMTLGQLAATSGETSYSGSIATITPAPEPGTLTLMGMGLFGLLAFSRRRNK